MSWASPLVLACAALAVASLSAWGDDEAPGLYALDRDNVAVRFAAGSHGAAQQVLRMALGTREYLAPLFGQAEDFPIRVLWLPSDRWKEFTSLEYGFPSNSSRGEVLPAADLERPTGLAKLTELLDLEAAPAEMSQRFKVLLGLYADAPPEAVKAVIEDSTDFSVRYVANFILPHEICHALNNAAKTPREPWWTHEFQAQMAAIITCRALGLEADAELFELYYRLMYLGGRERVEETDVYRCGQLGGRMGIVNYAWYHGALVEMLHEIEGRSDEGFGERLLEVCRDRAAGKQQVTNAEFIALMSDAAGEDLSGWMADRWDLK